MDGHEDIILSEISQTQKDKFFILSLLCGIKKKKSNSQKERVEKWLPGAGVGGNKEGWVKGYRLLVIR